MSKVIVIGGGASGLVSAIYAAINGNKVILLERNNKCGKKLLLTGNGKCNYFNSDMNINHYNTSDKKVLQEIITSNYVERIEYFFKTLGIVPKIKNGYYYPMSNQSTSIVNALVNYAKLVGVDIKNNVLVEYINYLDDQFVLNTSDGVFKCSKVIIATGSKVLSKTGSDGMGYTFLKKFGHSIIKPLPALVQLIGKGKYFKNWAGVRCDVSLTHLEANQKIKEVKGEVQLTDYGISGICTFQLSGRIARGLDNEKKEEIAINFMPWLDIGFDEYMNKQNKKFTITQILEGFLNYKLVNVILFFAGIDRDSRWIELTDEQHECLKDYVLNFKIEIIDTKGFEHAQVCSGGIPLSEIDPTTMESRYQKGLYITGELLDIDGECGGYNLGNAWITGMIAGSSIKND